MSNSSQTSNEPYRELGELRGSELNVNSENVSRCNRNFGNCVERSLELSSVVVIPDGKLFFFKHVYYNMYKLLYVSLQYY